MSEGHVSNSNYFIPDLSHWPITGSVGLFLVFVGCAMALNEVAIGTFVAGCGATIMLFMLFGWFGQVITESMGGNYNRQVDISFRWGMAWFIFSEVMFFAAFFGALLYARVYSVPWLGGEGTGILTQKFLWPDFTSTWPPLALPDSSNFIEPTQKVGALWIPFINTVILLSSGLTVTLAHWALKKDKQKALAFWLFITVALGFIFVGMQAYEYSHIISAYNLTLNSGIYGTVFYMLTGFHGFHVILGAIMLLVIWLRCLKGHFSMEKHFAFEAVAWYWHFVDVVWLFLFVFVYIL
ncbi:MAG: cytochrome c oxidase subunit 3 [Candidatus Porifericomitaceae bacterium WSBS_2022_MAG_OTU9]